MKYGLEVANGGEIAHPSVLKELAREAEDAGWDGIYLEDYIVWQGHADLPTYDPWVLLAAMASSTSRIRLGTTVTPISRRRPWKLAREAVTLDHLSNGRLTLGIGLGDLGDPGFAAVGEKTSLTTRAEIVDEALTIVVGLWSGTSFTFHGKHFKIDSLRCLPVPVQRPRIPIWVGGSWPFAGVIHRSALYDGFVGGKRHGDDEDWRLSVAEVQSLRASIQAIKGGDQAFEIALGGAPPGDDIEADRRYVEAVGAAGATWWMEYVSDDVGDLEAIRRLVRSGPLNRR